MILAIKQFNAINKKKTKKFLLLGDMLELGSKTNLFHRNLAQHINNGDIDKVFVIGKYISETFKLLKKNKKGEIFKTINDVKYLIKDHINDNDTLMIKGSYATGLNNFSKKLKSGEIS